MSVESNRPLEPSEVLVNQAEARRNDAEAALFQAQRQEAEAKAEEARIKANFGAIQLREAERKERKELAQNEHHHVYVFDREVNSATVKEAIKQLTTWDREDPECRIEFQINSPGGSIVDGLALVDFMRSLREKGHIVDTIALGWAASMGGVLLQVGTTRIMGANSVLLIHEGSMGAIGDFGQVEDRVELMKLFHERILALFEERARPINPKTTKAFIKRNWERKDWWISAENALKYGFIDEVR